MARVVGTGRCEWPGECLSALGGASYDATVLWMSCAHHV
ncbi:hypothetical protein SLI_2763 [Streptomyces lividans 1326]|uniref:Uncharacterized protein n=1 Tax=Streptomyces lividans 1326 TaxID=1200984 RepID=A0A7U9HB75_STRLI|nr:hypothetical protein SLI_2763 [Streptomyces lividans 1326]